MDKIERAYEVSEEAQRNLDRIKLRYNLRARKMVLGYGAIFLFGLLIIYMVLKDAL